MVARGASAIGGRRVTRLRRKGGEPGKAGEACVLLLLPLWLLLLLEMVLFVQVFVRILVLVVRSFGFAVRLVVVGVHIKFLFMTLRVMVGSVAVLIFPSLGSGPVLNEVPLFVLQSSQTLAISGIRFPLDPTLVSIFVTISGGACSLRAHSLQSVAVTCVVVFGIPGSMTGCVNFSTFVTFVVVVVLVVHMVVVVSVVQKSSVVVVRVVVKLVIPLHVDMAFVITLYGRTTRRLNRRLSFVVATDVINAHGLATVLSCAGRSFVCVVATASAATASKPWRVVALAGAAALRGVGVRWAGVFTEVRCTRVSETLAFFTPLMRVGFVAFRPNVPLGFDAGFEPMVITRKNHVYFSIWYVKVVVHMAR